MQIPDLDPSPADVAAIGVFTKNLDDVMGATKTVVNETGWSYDEARAYLLGNLDRLAETARELPRAQVIDVTNPQAPSARRDESRALDRPRAWSVVI